MEKPAVHLLDLLGVEKVEGILFKVRPDLRGNAHDVKVIREICDVCGKPNVTAWEFNQNGEAYQYTISKVCAACMVAAEDKSFTQELIKKRQNALLDKWYKIPDSDNSGFKNYEPVNNATAKALDTAKKFTKEILSGKAMNLLLTGSVGTGKSHLSKAIARTVKEKGGRSVAYIEAADLFDEIKQTFGHDRNNERFYKEYSSYSLMIIDDVGLETKKQSEISWTVSEWTKLLNARQGKSTVYTTNFDDVSLAEVVGPRAHSRMYMNSMFIDLFTDDYRKRLQII
ncbi:ATP-binding protein (plasmid) [Neobacillus sp. SCS-31]|uniref:ATP-binding protein n=1 Tax=Neobacillus oceani TaxID=3115292 RepID=UPI003906295D